MITNARYTREADDDLEVCWNGVNDGHDGDLLNPARRTPEKIDGGPIRASLTSGTARDAVFDALPVRHAEALTFREVIRKTGLKPSSVNSALHVLRGAGRLASEALPAAQGYRSRPPQRYWRRA